jgi:hypothetical protein
MTKSAKRPLPRGYLQLYPNAAGVAVAFEELTAAEKRHLLEQFGQAELFDRVVFEHIESRSLFARMLLERLTAKAAEDPIARADLELALPKRKSGRPAKWDEERLESFLSYYFFLQARSRGGRSEVVDKMAQRAGFETTQAVEDKISEALKRLDPERVKFLRKTFEYLGSADG